MFQTEPILFLQSRGGDVLDAAMIFVSLFGYPAFYVVVVSVLVFAVDFRRGFVLLQALLWTGALTEVLKTAFALPRPFDADSRVLDVAGGRAVRTKLLAMGGRSFFDLPQEEALSYVRGRADWSYGLPSGHTSGCTAFSGGLALLWESRRGAVAACAAILAMAFSRVYLGRHFLADVLGGLTLGILLLAVLAWWISGPLAAGRLPATTGLSRSPLAVGALLGPPLVLPLLSLRADAAGLMFGINLGFLVVGLGGYPSDAGSGWRRAARASLALLLVASTGWLAGRLGSALGPHGDRTPIAFALGALPGFALMWGTTALARRSGLYSR